MIVCLLLQAPRPLPARVFELERSSDFERDGKLTAVRLPKCDRMTHVQSRVVSWVAIGETRTFRNCRSDGGR